MAFQMSSMEMSGPNVQDMTGPAADSPLLPPEKQKQSKLQRRAPNAKAVLIE